LTFALEIINFLVLVWILKRFLYQPVLAAIGRRRAAIEETITKARAKQAEAQSLEHDYRGRLEKWESEKQALLATAVEEVNAERARRVTALKAALDAERDKRRALDEQQMADWRRRAAEEATRQSVEFAARLFARLASPELEARLVPAAVDDLAHLPESQLQAIRSACGEAGNEMNVTTAYPLAEPQRRALVDGICAAAKADVIPHFAEDRRLLAGLRVTVGPWVMRANLQDELRFFAEATHRAA